MAAGYALGLGHVTPEFGQYVARVRIPWRVPTGREIVVSNRMGGGAPLTGHRRVDCSTVCRAERRCAPAGSDFVRQEDHLLIQPSTSRGRGWLNVGRWCRVRDRPRRANVGAQTSGTGGFADTKRRSCRGLAVVVTRRAGVCFSARYPLNPRKPGAQQVPACGMDAGRLGLRVRRSGGRRRTRVRSRGFQTSLLFPWGRTARRVPWHVLFPQLSGR